MPGNECGGFCTRDGLVSLVAQLEVFPVPPGCNIPVDVSAGDAVPLHGLLPEARSHVCARQPGKIAHRA